MGNCWTRRRCSNPSTPSRAFKRALLGLALLGLSGLAQAIELPARFMARYEVTHLGLTLGESRIEYEELEAGQRYRYSSKIKAAGIASLFTSDSISERSEGRITERGFLPERYVYDRQGRKVRQARLSFDWDSNIVTNDVAGSAWRMEIPDGAKDRMVTQLQLMHDLARAEEDLVYQVADGGKLRSYSLRIDGRDIISTPYGDFEAIRLKEIRDDNDRATTLWVAPALDYLAVRIDHRDHDDNFRMTLQELEGFGLDKRELKPEDFGVKLTDN